VVVGTIAIFFVGLGTNQASAAGTGYGPGSRSGSTPPGGFTTTVTSTTVAPSGGKVAAAYDGEKLLLVIPAGDFTTPVQVTVTAPTLSQIPRAVVAFDLTFVVDGKSLAGSLSRPVTFTITSSSIQAKDVVDVWSGSAWVPYAGATLKTGSAKITVTSDPAFAVLTSTTVPASTTATTGFPVLGLGGIAVGLTVLGGGGLVLTRRRRPARP
jgi:hypothetical protein